MDQRSFELVQNPRSRLLLNEKADAMSHINRALHQKGITEARVAGIREAIPGRLLGTTTNTTAIEALLKYRDLVLNAARLTCRGIVDLAPHQTWKRTKVYGIPITHYMGKGTRGLKGLREELEAENEGIRIPSDIRWLGRIDDVQARFLGGRIVASSVTFAI